MNCNETPEPVTESQIHFSLSSAPVDAPDSSCFKRLQVSWPCGQHQLFPQLLASPHLQLIPTSSPHPINTPGCSPQPVWRTCCPSASLSQQHHTKVKHEIIETQNVSAHAAGDAAQGMVTPASCFPSILLPASHLPCPSPAFVAPGHSITASVEETWAEKQIQVQNQSSLCNSSSFSPSPGAAANPDWISMRSAVWDAAGRELTASTNKQTNYTKGWECCGSRGIRSTWVETGRGTRWEKALKESILLRCSPWAAIPAPQPPKGR